MLNNTSPSMKEAVCKPASGRERIRIRSHARVMSVRHLHAATARQSTAKPKRPVTRAMVPRGRGPTGILCTLLVVRDDTEKARQYEIMRQRATALLALFMLIYVGHGHRVTRTAGCGTFWLGLVRATSEAAMVGGVADWFAVTALFRHPLGIPIPHTAIVAKAEGPHRSQPGEFRRQHFFAREVIARQLAACVSASARRDVAARARAPERRRVPSRAALPARPTPCNHGVAGQRATRRSCDSFGRHRWHRSLPTSCQSPPRRPAPGDARSAGDPREPGGEDNKEINPRSHCRGKPVVGAGRR